MAFLKNIDTQHALSLKNAYVRIDEIFGTKDNLKLRIKFYVSQDAAVTGKSAISEEIYTFTPSTEENSKNIWKQGYEYLKTLQEFENSVDVLED